MKLVGKGRCAQVFEHSPTTVLKLYDPGFDRAWVEASARTAAAVVEAGIPAPPVHGVESLRGRHGVVFGLIDGVTMWEVAANQPELAAELGHKLALLHLEVHRCQLDHLPDRVARLRQRVNQAPGDAGIDEAARQAAEQYLADPPAEPAVLTHGDLHPGNVMVEANGRAVAIDWDFPMTGPASAEVARTHYLVSDWALAPGTNPAVAKVRSEMANVFLSAYLDDGSVTEEAIDRWRLPLLVDRLAAGIKSERRLVADEIDRLVGPRSVSSHVSSPDSD